MEAVTYQPFGISLLVKALLHVQRWDDAADALDRAEAIITQSGESWYLPEVWRLKSCVMQQRGDREAAEDLLRHAVEMAHSQNARFWELRAASALGRMLLDDGDEEQAVEVVKPVHEWFKEGLDTEHLQAARALLTDYRV